MTRWETRVRRARLVWLVTNTQMTTLDLASRLGYNSTESVAAALGEMRGLGYLVPKINDRTRRGTRSPTEMPCDEKLVSTPIPRDESRQWIDPKRDVLCPKSEEPTRVTYDPERHRRSRHYQGNFDL